MASRLVLLGCGKMGGALVQGWLARGHPAEAIQVIDPQPAAWLAESGVAVNPGSPGPAEAAILAVKPQMMAQAAPALADLAAQGCAMISIAAGTTLATLAGYFGAEAAILRAMPNTPAAVGRGITALVANAAGARHLALAETLMQAVGETVRLDDEAQMDAVTGLSGSGPAYVFHLIEALAAAGEAAGLPPAMALHLARATVTGAGALAAADPADPATLRQNVTSPGGTTAAGLAVLMPELTDLMTRTVAAATARSRALAG